MEISCSHFLLRSAVLFMSLISITRSTTSHVPTVIFVDSFTEYLSGHAKRYCDEHCIRIVECVSPYMQKVLSSQGYDIPDSLKSPNEGEEMDWAVSLNLFNEDDDDYNDENSNRRQATAVKSMRCPNIICLSESDAGVGTAERIQEELHLRGNGKSPHLRNKYLLNERASENGIKVVKQKLVQSIQDLESFLINSLHWKSVKKPTADDHVVDESVSQQPIACVLKPCIGVASEGVHKCHNFKEVKTAFQKLFLKPKYGGGLNEALVVQECLEGTEYAVDTVSRDGEIKVVALWKYKKYQLNRAPFVYQCSELVSARGVWEKQICNYCVDVLTAAGVKWGPTHTEIMMTKDGPRLVEVNGRWHAQHFKPITDRCLGYDALTASIDAAFFPEKFDSLPSRPNRLQAEGVIIHLISVKQGKITNINHIDVLKQLKSVIFIHMEYNIDDQLVKTVDIRTDCGYILLSHPDRQIMEEDYATIVKLQPTLFDVESLDENDNNDNNNKVKSIHHKNKKDTKLMKKKKKKDSNKINGSSNSNDDDYDEDNIDLDIFFEKVADDFVVSSSSPFDDNEDYDVQPPINEMSEDVQAINDRITRNIKKVHNKNAKSNSRRNKRRSAVVNIPAAAEEAIGFDSSYAAVHDNNRINDDDDDVHNPILDKNIDDDISYDDVMNNNKKNDENEEKEEEDRSLGIEQVDNDVEVIVEVDDVNDTVNDDDDDDEDEDFIRFSQGLNQELQSFAESSDSGDSSSGDSNSNDDNFINEEEQIELKENIVDSISDNTSYLNKKEIIQPLSSTTTSSSPSFSTEYDESLRNQKDEIELEEEEKEKELLSKTNPSIQTYIPKTQIYNTPESSSSSSSIQFQDKISSYQSSHQGQSTLEEPTIATSIHHLTTTDGTRNPYTNRLKEKTKGIKQKLYHQFFKIIQLLKKSKTSFSASSSSSSSSTTSTIEHDEKMTKNQQIRNVLTSFKAKCSQIVLSFRHFRHHMKFPKKLTKFQLIQRLQHKINDKLIKHIMYKLGKISWNSPGLKLLIGSFQIIVLSYILTFISIVFIIPSLENYIL